MINKILCWLKYHQWSNWEKTGFTTNNNTIHWGGRCIHCNHYESMWFNKLNPPKDKEYIKYRGATIR